MYIMLKQENPEMVGNNGVFTNSLGVNSCTKPTYGMENMVFYVDEINVLLHYYYYYISILL